MKPEHFKNPKFIERIKARTKKLYPMEKNICDKCGCEIHEAEVRITLDGNKIFHEKIFFCVCTKNRD